MLIFIRHGKRLANGRLSREGKREAKRLRKYFTQQGLTEAVIAPNERARQTAIFAGLQIRRTLPELSAGDYESYFNHEVLQRMQAQPGQPWKQSFTRAVVEDDLFDSVFSCWGARLLGIARDISCLPDLKPLNQGMDSLPDPEFSGLRSWQFQSLVFIGSSPLIELAFLAANSNDWRLFPRCCELEGFSYDPQSGKTDLIKRTEYGLN